MKRFQRLYPHYFYYHLIEQRDGRDLYHKQFFQHNRNGDDCILYSEIIFGIRIHC
jgi:hypothetical protein